MKRLFIIIQFSLITLISAAQFRIDTATFKAFSVEAYEGNENKEGLFIPDKHYDTTRCYAIFYIEGNRVTTNLRDPLKSFYFIEDLGYSSNLLGSLPGYAKGCLDRGFYICQMNIVYQESNNIYIIRIDYSDTRFIFQCTLSNERFVKNQIIDYTEDNFKYENDPTYTNKEILDFFYKAKADIKNIIINFK